jgi:hypothetical protein
MTPAPVPRLLVLIGSGETGPQIGRLHRYVIRRLCGDSRRPRELTAAILDTPYGFQENADSLSAELVDYFARRLGMNAALASFRRTDDDILSRETALARITAADYVFSGPGSPSYALRVWSGTRVPDLFGAKLRDGGAVVLASAAALTAGTLTVPVYELYKVGDDPRWLPGLGVLTAAGIDAAVIPHYDNGEGSGHDTRFCFLGERRLAELESMLPDDTYILGIDEHTALLIDLDAETASVHGRGTVSIRVRGDSDQRPAGTEFPLADLQRPPGPVPRTHAARSRGEAIESNLAERLLELETRVASLGDRSRLADALLDMLVELRTAARGERDFATADGIRDRLSTLGVELTDSADGTTVRK